MITGAEFTERARDVCLLTTGGLIRVRWLVAWRALLPERVCCTSNVKRSVMLHVKQFRGLVFGRLRGDRKAKRKIEV